MPITTPVDIVIILVPASTERPSAQPLGFGAIQVVEIPSEQGRAFELSARSSNGAVWEAPLSLAQSQALVALLDQLPVEGMAAPTMSMDGVSYRVQIVQEGPPSVFTWSNEDWRFASQVPKESWEAVAALAEYVEGLEKELRPE